MKTTNNLNEVNGNHYERLSIEPVILFKFLGLNWFQAEPIKYLSRFWNKNGVTDINKAIHIMAMARDLGITTPGDLINKPSLVENYIGQFYGYFSRSTDPGLNRSMFQRYTKLYESIISCDWERAIYLAEQIKYYFYGKEEQEICQ